MTFGIISLFIFDNNYFQTAGKIIWFGTIALFLLNGFIVSLFSDFNLQFGYGGWKIKRK
jgi:hypothetical protein